MITNRLIKNVKIVTPIGRRAAKGAEMAELHTVENGVIAILDGKIAYAGDAMEFPAELVAYDYEITDGGGRVALPGFIDSHTHLVFGGFRPDEFSWRLKGDSYMSIMERGGGIQSTVNATRGMSAPELTDKARWFIDRMSEQGITTIEAKSGYGLDFPTELAQLEAINLLSEEKDRKADVVPTFLGAHSVPSEYKGRTSEYVDFLIEDCLPKFSDMARFCDIFTEKNVFEIEDSRRLLNAAKNMGYKLKLHADEIVTLGGAELAAEVGAVSADHLLHVSEEGIKNMAERGVVATLLPLTAFALREPYAPARKFIEAGAAVALASDLNPGSCFSGSIPLTIALACIYMHMSIEETITALTLNGAAALDLAESKGSLEVGKDGDVVLLHFDNIHFLPYYVGMNCVQSVFKGGRLVFSQPLLNSLQNK